jgi:hypothetical protein
VGKTLAFYKNVVFLAPQKTLNARHPLSTTASSSVRTLTTAPQRLFLFLCPCRTHPHGRLHECEGENVNATIRSKDYFFYINNVT